MYDQHQRFREIYNVKQRVEENTRRLQRVEFERRELEAMLNNDHHLLNKLRWEIERGSASDPIPSNEAGRSPTSQRQQHQPPTHQPKPRCEDRTHDASLGTGSGDKWRTRSFWTSFNERSKPRDVEQAPGEDRQSEGTIEIAVVDERAPNRITIDVIRPDGSRSGPIRIRPSWSNIAKVIIDHGPITAQLIALNHPHAKLDHLTDLCNRHKDTIGLVFHRPGPGKHPDFKYRLRDPRPGMDRECSSEVERPITA